MQIFYPQLGTLLNGGLVHGLPVWTQPGGPGTIVFPQQRLGEMVGLWVMPYCQHWTNNLDLHFAMEVGGVQSCLICCPLCSMIVRILTPASLYLDNNSNFILFP
jgi:hypothetical protein